MSETDRPLLSTGVPGLDDVLHGGLAPARIYLVEGHPGSGKTTLALQFLLEGLARGDSGLLISLSESREEMDATAAAHGWSLAGLQILEIVAADEILDGDARYGMFHPSEIELAETTRQVLQEAERVRPARIVFDSLSELRLLAENRLRFRRQILGLKQRFARLGATVLLVDDRTAEDRDLELHSIAHGVIALERRTPEYGVLRRQCQVTKMRGRRFREGLHDFVVETGGLRVFPRLVAAEHTGARAPEEIPSGVEALDRLLGGGLPRGTSTLIAGAAGTGKSTLAAQYLTALCRRGERAAAFLFDESLDTLRQRSAALGMELRPLLDDGRLVVRHVDPAQLSPGQFAHQIREEVEQRGVGMVVVDSLNGYLNSMPSERHLALHLYELLTYLGHRGVSTLLLMTEHGIIGSPGFPVDMSYLADTVVLLRYFEALGEVRRAVSVIKKRTGRHETTIRELRFAGGLEIGEPLRDFQGVLTGVPELLGGSSLESRKGR